MITKAKLVAALIGIVALVLLLMGTWLHGDRHGKLIERSAHYAAADALRAELNDLKTSSSAAVATRDDIIRQEREEADDKINDLLQKNESLQAWWDSAVHPAAVEYAYGLR